MEEKELQKTEKFIPDNGISNDRYDVSEPWVNAVVLPEEEEAEGVTFRYDFNGDEVAKALKIFQKKMLRKKNLIYTSIFMVVELLYLNRLASNPEDLMSKILAVLCVVAVIYIWYMPWNHIRSIKAATDAMAEPPSFTLTVNEKGLINRDEGSPAYLIPYTQEKMQAAETADLFVLMVSKEKCFVVPKRCLTPAQAEEVTAYLKAGLKEKYEYLLK